MEIKKYMESDRETQRKYVQNAESDRLVSDLDDIIWIYSKKSIPEYNKDSTQIGLVAIMNEIRRRLDEADTTNAAKHLLMMGFDQDKNSTRDFIQAINELKKTAYK